MTKRWIEEDGIVELRARLKGEVVTATHPDYDGARHVWNAMIDRRPAAVVRPAGEEDVAEAVRFASENDVLLAVRGGGHSVAGHGTCEGGLVIDLGAGLNRVTVDASARLAKADGGCLLRDVDRACQAHDLVIPAGVVSHTGAGGLTLGGGIGWLTRKFGLTCDSVLAARVVLASGEIVTADESNHPDLYWALRGGGGNFGVVTQFTYRCHPFPTAIPVVLAGWRLAEAEPALQAYAEWMARQPDEVKASAIMMRPGADSPVPAELVGQPCLLILQVWAGTDMTAAERAFQPLAQAARPAFQRAMLMPYVDLQQIQDNAFRSGKCNYTKAGYIDDLNSNAITALLESAAEGLDDQSLIEVIPGGGAVLRVGDQDTAFPDRKAAYSFNVYARWPLGEDDTPYIAWVRRAFERLDRHSRAGVYVNFFNPDEGQDRVLAAYGRERYTRLAQLKARYDPMNLFSVNANIRPSPSVAV